MAGKFGSLGRVGEFGEIAFEGARLVTVYLRRSRAAQEERIKEERKGEKRELGFGTKKGQEESRKKHTDDGVVQVVRNMGTGGISERDVVLVEL